MTMFRPYLFPLFEEVVGLLSLHPLMIAGMVAPILDGDGGISIAVVEDHDQGVLCVIDPWTSMQEGDAIDIWLDTQKVLHLVVTTEDVNLRFFFYLPAALFVPGWIEECYFVLLRKGEVTPDDPSVPRRLLVKLDRPGGPDKEPHKPGHSELKAVQLPQEVIDNGVDAGWAAKGVPMTISRYPNIAVHDTLQGKWGSVFLEPFVLTQAHVDGIDPIVIIAKQADILAGGDSPALLVQYEVYDQVWNFSEKWSQTTTVKVEAGAWRLEPPIIKEADNGVIDLKALNQQNVTVQIHIREGEFEVDDTIRMTWIGTPQIGKPLIHILSQLITKVPSILEFSVPYAEVRAIAMGSADASYVLIKKNGDPPLSSKRTFASVIGDVYAHPAPELREVVGEILEPDTKFATVYVAYPGMAEGDFIVLIWAGTRSNGTPYVHQEQYTVSRNDAENKQITFYISGEHISVLVNGLLDLWYRVSNDKASIYGVSESEHLLVKVQAIPATLPAPKVPEANDDVLDPSKVFDKVTVLVDYLGAKKGEILTIHWISPNPFASTSDWLPITTVTEGKPVPFRVDADFVTASIGLYVKVRYTLKHTTGLYSYSDTLNLMIGYLVGELPPPDVIQAEGEPSNATLDPMKALAGVDIKVGYASMDPLLDIIGLYWRGVPGSGTSEDLELPGHDSKSVLFQLAAWFVGANINKMVSVSYGVKRYGYSTHSETTSLRILAFQDPENELPRPQVPQATAGVLDLMTFTGNPDVKVKAWPHIALKQRVWLWLEGKTGSGASYPINLLEGVEITQIHLDNGLNETVLRTELLKLGHASPATVVCQVTFDGSVEQHTAINFPALPLTIRTRYDYLTPIIDKVIDARAEVPEGGTTRDKEVTLEGTATREQTVELFEEPSLSLGTALVGTDGVWRKKVSNLTEKRYRITAKALYDAVPVSSEPRTFTVDFAVTPDITSITDSKGEVEPGKITYDNSVLIEGGATPGEQVRLLDGTTPVITLDVDDKGNWNHRFNNLSVKTYSLSIEALYDVEPTTSPPRTFIVAQAVTPTISSVTDIRGDIANNGTTYYRSVTLSGKASANEQIELRDGDTPLKTIQVGADGIWTDVFDNLTLKGYSLTVKALYGSGPVSSPARVFTVAAHISPTITSVTDAAGASVADGATTYASRVTVSGKATPREEVDLYDGANRIRSVTVKPSGEWELLLDVIIKFYSITARARYEVSPISSPARTFVVAAHIGPTLTSVKASGVELPDGDSTIATSVALTGQVSPNHEVQIRDNGSPRHTVRANGTTWSTTLSVGVGGHRITAYAIATGRESNSRGFTVRSPIPPLTINTSHVSLSAWIFRMEVTPPNPPAGAFVDRGASGGVPPYRYASSNPAVAEVNSSTGRVISKGNGSAQITVWDSVNQTASYSVSTSNVYRIFGTGIFGSYPSCSQRAAQMGGRIPSLAEWQSYVNIYQGIGAERRWCWAADRAGLKTQWAFYPATGAAQPIWDWAFNRQSADGFGIRAG